MFNMTREKLLAEVAKHPYWYHKIDLGLGVVTPGFDYDDQWNMVREVRNYIDYKNKKVLDIASFDGMWAFEAEKLGAELVVAIDSYFETYKNFLFCREVLNSNVIPYYNVPVYDLVGGLSIYLEENMTSSSKHQRQDRLFDVIQHLGLLYHLRDPLRSLLQARSCIREGGLLLMETAVIYNREESFMLYNGTSKPYRFYNDATTWWAPTINCLKEMLDTSLFKPIDETLRILPQAKPDGTDKPLVGRVCIVAQAVNGDKIDADKYKELCRSYRTPGLAVENLIDNRIT